MFTGLIVKTSFSAASRNSKRYFIIVKVSYEFRYTWNIFILSRNSRQTARNSHVLKL